MDALINSVNASAKFVFVIGPTATGKSAWAIEQAEKYQGSILNIDSVQFYKGLQVGSAAPSELEKSKVPHYLYSYISAPEEMTAGNYLRDFYKLLASEKLRSPVFIVGGTGFYIQALEKGMYDIEPIDPMLRKKIEEELSSDGPEKLFQELSGADPQHQIHINDHYRLVRAIEVLRYNQKTPTDLKQRTQTEENKNAFPYPFIKLGFSRSKEKSLEKVEARTKWMLENGIIDEVKPFLQNGFASWAPLSSVGYKEVVEHLLHNTSSDELFKNIVFSTMRLIKKQKTWFKRDLSVLWSDFSADSLQRVNDHLDQFLTRIDDAPLGKR